MGPQIMKLINNEALLIIEIIDLYSVYHLFISIIELFLLYFRIELFSLIHKI